jgi:hypothetical protein
MQRYSDIPITADILKSYARLVKIKYPKDLPYNKSAVEEYYDAIIINPEIKGLSKPQFTFTEWLLMEPHERKNWLDVRDGILQKILGEDEWKKWKINKTKISSLSTSPPKVKSKRRTSISPSREYKTMKGLEEMMASMDL